MLAWLFFLALNGLVFAGAWMLARGVLRATGPRLLLAAALIGWVSIVIGCAALGAFGCLRLGPAFVGALFVAACGLVARWITARAGGRPGSLHAWQLAGDVPARGASAAPVAGVDRAGSVPALARWAAGLAVALAAWAAWDLGIAALTAPVQPVSDAPIYHLYFAVRWWKAATLARVPTPFGDSAAPYFPANADVWFTWLILPFGRETLAKLGQAPFLPLAMTALFALARELGVRPIAALVPACVWGSGTGVLVNATVANADLVMATWYLVAVLFLVRHARSRCAGDLACAGLAAGAALGTKTVAVLFVPWLVLAGLVLVFRRGSGAGGPGLTPARARARWGLCALFGVCLILPCGYWYARNLLDTGNPLYPLRVELAGHTLLPGWYTRDALGAGGPYHIPTERVDLFAQILLRGWDPVLVPALVIGLAAAVWSAARGRPLAGLLASLAVLHLVLFWWVNPYQTQERFLFVALALAAVPLALVLDRWPLLTVPVALAIGWHLVVDQVGLGIRELSPLPAPMHLRLTELLGMPSGAGVRAGLGRLVLFGCAAGAVALLSWAQRGPLRRRVSAACVAAGLVVAGSALRIEQLSIADPRLAFYPVWTQGGYLPGWLRLEDASGPAARVAYAGTNLPYYLFAVGLRNEVRYVNIDRHRGFLMHDYHVLYAERGEGSAANATPDWDRRAPDEAAWLDNLRDERIGLVFIGLTNHAGGEHNIYDQEGFPIERTWAERNPGLFRLLHADRFTRLYAVQWPSSHLGEGLPRTASETSRP